MSEPTNFDIHSAENDMLLELIDEAKEQVNTVDALVDAVGQKSKSLAELLFSVQQLSSLLSRPSENEDYRTLGIVGHRFEDYLTNVRELTPKGLADVRTFVEVLEDMLEGNVPMEGDASQIVRTLPAKGGFDDEELEVRHIEVMLVMLPGTATRYVERELQQCGYRVSTVSSTFDALSMIIRTKPDFVVVSAMMPELNGIDLAISLTTMPATRNVPLALITSLEDDDDYLNLLPANVPVIHKGESFGDDLFKALDDMFLI